MTSAELKQAIADLTAARELIDPETGEVRMAVTQRQLTEATAAEQIERLQRALAFWLPSVPADNSDFAKRAGDDAYLLVGYEGPTEPCAEEIGWTRHVAVLLEIANA